MAKTQEIEKYFAKR